MVLGDVYAQKAISQILRIVSTLGRIKNMLLTHPYQILYIKCESVQIRINGNVIS